MYMHISFMVCLQKVFQFGELLTSHAKKTCVGDMCSSVIACHLYIIEQSQVAITTFDSCL